MVRRLLPIVFHKNKIFSLITAILMISGCASTPHVSVSKEYVISPESENGLLVGSIKYIGYPHTKYQVYFRGLDNNEQGYFEVGESSGLGPHSFEFEESLITGELLVKELLAGDYEISRWEVIGDNFSLSQIEPFSIKSRIEPGKVTYIGSFVFELTYKDGSVDFIEAFAEDSQVLRQLYPNLASTEIFMGIEHGLVKKNIGGKSELEYVKQGLKWYDILEGILDGLGGSSVPVLLTVPPFHF